MAEYLLFATERYALPILQPLAQALQASGPSGAAWFDEARRGHDAGTGPQRGACTRPSR